MTVLREYEYEDHTADIKIVGYGNTPKRAIEALILGMFNICLLYTSPSPRDS